MSARPRVIIIGAGFGGLYAARTLERQNFDVLLVDRNNYHTFTPLLYQVATCGLDPSEIAYPVRGIFGADSNVRFLMGEVRAIETSSRQVNIQVNGSLRHEPYDFLIVAGGSVTNFFNKPEFVEVAYELKTLEDAIRLRSHLLRKFETAAWSGDAEYKNALTNLVVVGGGPTGLETAGALYELLSKVLRREYPFLREVTPTVYLVEATQNLLSAYPESLRLAAREQLESLGVRVKFGSAVTEVARDHVVLADGTRIPTYTLIWLAGVKASPLAELLGVPLHRSGRVLIEGTTQAVGLEDVYVIGDMAYLEDDSGQAYPMLAPVAQQQGVLAASNIMRKIRGEPMNQFRYRDRGTMATIGRNRAVAYIFNRVRLSGYLAWVSWLALHLLTLLGFRNRVSVLFSWVWNYFTYDRSVRLIIDGPPPVELTTEKKGDEGLQPDERALQ